MKFFLLFCVCQIFSSTCFALGGGAMELLPTSDIGIKIFVRQTDIGSYEIAIWVTDQKHLFDGKMEAGVMLKFEKEGQTGIARWPSEILVGTSKTSQSNALFVALKTADGDLVRRLRDDPTAEAFFFALTPALFAAARVEIQQLAPYSRSRIYWADLHKFSPPQAATRQLGRQKGLS